MFAAVASTSTSSFPVCSAAQKTKRLGSHLLHPLVLYTTMAKKADKGVMAKKAGKGGGWKPWLIPQAGKGVTAKREKYWQRTKIAFAKAQAYHGEFAKAAQEAHQAQLAFTKAVARFEIAAKALEKTFSA